MVYQRGEIVLVPFPFSDQSTYKVRPAVVISSGAYHQTEPDVLLAGITSNVVGATGLFDYVLVDWQVAGLKFPSAFKPVVFTLHPKRILHRVGNIAANDMTVINTKLKLAFGL
ncbi:MAG: type II toxin-antitoxin system PemK/MazF family toxin [Anaerolineae bacterium]|nr:type II toxin-antitoxin system PemK/MazF family toxin [Anaerolineae bacterium]